MKYCYPILQRLCLVFWAAVLLTVFTYHQGLSQNTSSIEQGVFRVKVTEELAQQLERARLSRTSDDVMLTGIQALDRIHQAYKVKGIQRVFRPAGKFEAKHRRYGLHRWYEIQLDKAAPLLQALNAYKSLQQVEKAEPVYKKAIIGSDNKNYGPVVVKPEVYTKKLTLPGTSNDPLLPNQWHYNNTGQTGGKPGADISLLQAWVLETGKSNVIVAVTDGGIQVNHPDIAANVWVNSDEIPGNNIDDDNNGYVDDINGYGFGDNTGTIAPDQHGTHVGGTIAAVNNNGIGVAGVAGGSGTGDGARLMSCAAFGANGTGGFAETYVYGADNGAVISQNSWGYTNPDVFEQAVLDGIDYFIAEAGLDENGNQVGPMKGGIVIFAAGNDNSDNKWYPGYYDKTLAVSGTNHRDKKAWYSNFGAWVDIAAPGGETSGVPVQQGVLSTLSNNQYGYFQGTSMATPHVSGVAALIVSKFGGPGLTPQILRQRLVQTTDNIDADDPPFAGKLGSGRLNAFAALQENDNEAPEAIDDLQASAVGITTVTLTWTAPADAGNGSASSYDIRYSTSPITPSNFSSATPVPDPPVPHNAGTTETYTVTGLSPGTVYYFAVKSADFFGNVSAISNVVEQATNFAPVLALHPSSLTVNLITADTAIETLWIVNKGKGPLTFTFPAFPPQNHFAHPSPTSGTVPAFDSTAINITFDASHLFAGTYHQDLLLLTNDPVADTVNIPLTLVVSNNNAPIAGVIPDSLDFGGVFEGGSVTRTLTVSNEGSDPLVVSSISSSSPEFTVDLAVPFTVNAFRDTTVHVIYTASGIGVDTGTLTINTNDAAHPSFTVFLRGEGLPAPGIEVSPDTLYQELNTGKTAQQHITVSNTGGSNLELSIDVSSSGVSVATSKVINLPSKPVGVSGGNEKQKTAKRSAAPVTLRSVSTSAVATKVLILSPDNDVTDLQSLFEGFDDIDATIFPKASLPGITLADVEAYDIIVTSNNTQWLAAGNVDPAVIGNLLADYIDQGGKVIVNQFAYSYDAWKLTGRFITEQYGPFTPSTTDQDIEVSLGDILAPAHPLLSGVNSLDYSGFVQNVGLAPGATAVAKWDNGDLFLAANANVVALNLLPSLGNGGPFQWEGDLPTIYQNAVHYLSGPSFVRVTPKEAVVAPGDHIDLEVTFDATGLDAGIYDAFINLNSNVPQRELTVVPATLKVLGPAFTVSPDSLEESLEKGQKSTRTLLLKNNSPVSSDFHISVVGNGVTSSVAVKKAANPSAKTEILTARASAPEGKRTTAFKGSSLDPESAAAIPDVAKSASARTLSVVQPTGTLTRYSTSFEEFAIGDIDGQQGWEGQFGNWVVESIQPASGAQHLRAVSDGLGQTLAFSPEVNASTQKKSTTTMRLNLTGSGVTWQVIPQSVSAGFVNTRFEFGANGKVRALVSNGSGGGGYVTIPVTIPSGYFDFTITVDRATSVFDVYFNTTKVFTGQGFAGDIQQVVLLSLMQTAGPALNVDDFQIIDGEREVIPQYLTVSPLSGTLASGEAIEIKVNFDATQLAFGTYHADIIIDVDSADSKLTVPTALHVIGDPGILVDPTVLQATVNYKEDTVKYFEIENTGGSPLQYNLQVIGAGVDVKNLPSSPVSKFTTEPKELQRITEKQAKDAQRSKVQQEKKASVQVYAGTSLFEEHFEGGTFPPSSWNVKDNAGNGVVWDFAANWGESNYAGTGEAATASSDAAGLAEFDTELITPEINVTGFKNVTVQYNANYQNFANLDYLDLDIQLAGEATWTNVLRWNEDHGSFRGASGEFVSVNLDEYLGTATSFRLRWHYYDPNTDDFDWYAQVDDIVVLGNARAWLAVEPASGTVPVRERVKIKATFDASDIESGFYVAGILVKSNATANPLVGVVASLEVLQPAVIHVEPDSLYQEVPLNGTATQTLAISNSGESELHFTIGRSALPGPSKVKQARIDGKEKRTQPTQTSYDRNSIKAIAINKPATKATVEQYATGFEEFAEGDIDGQEGWNGQFSNYTIESENPHEGQQHLRGLSDGLGQSLAFSPEVEIGNESISSTVLYLDLDEAAGTTWQIIPQSTTAQFVNTRFEFSPDGSLQVLVTDSLGNAGYVPVDAQVPSGYFEFRIDVERATNKFTVYFDGNEVFSGLGFAGDIEQVVIFSLMETAGSILDVDNFSIFDGQPETPWVTVSPKAGSVSSGETAIVSVNFNAQDLAPGIYTDTLYVNSNDPAHPSVSVPVTLNVIENYAPVIGAVSDTSLVERETLTLTFTATDVDDSLVNVTLKNPPPFASKTAWSNGTATYTFKPQIGQAGTYPLWVVATDGRGKRDSVSFTLTVYPYGVASFSLVNLKTGETVATFTDSLTVNAADADFSKWTIRANTKPTKVGSVIFNVDGGNQVPENSLPYDLNRSVFTGLSAGTHIVKADAYTAISGRGQKGKGLIAHVTIKASSAIKSLVVVNTHGDSLTNLIEGTVININDPAFKAISIVAIPEPPRVGSVVFYLNGKYVRTENSAPYSLNGDGSGGYISWPAKVGNYTLTVQPFSKPFGGGIAGDPLTVHFSVIKGAVTAHSTSVAREGEETAQQEATLTVYPVPVRDEFSISLQGYTGSAVQLIIRNVQGEPIYNEYLSTEKAQQHSISASKLNLQTGVYYIQLIGSDGFSQIRKVLKE